MGDENEYVDVEDLNTPSEAELDNAYGSKFLGVTDVGDRKIKTRILRVGKEEVKERDTGRTKVRAVLFLEGLDKALLLNATNKATLDKALGKNPANWKGAPLGILVDPTVVYQGRRGGVRIRVLGPLPPKPKVPEEPPPADFDPDLNDSVPDFRQ